MITRSQYSRGQGPVPVQQMDDGGDGTSVTSGGLPAYPGALSGGRRCAEVRRGGDFRCQDTAGPVSSGLRALGSRETRVLVAGAPCWVRVSRRSPHPPPPHPRRVTRPRGWASEPVPVGRASPCRAYFKLEPWPEPHPGAAFPPSLAASPKRETISHNYKDGAA